jgi:DNA-binding NtrC family response regulator
MELMRKVALIADGDHLVASVTGLLLQSHWNELEVVVANSCRKAREAFNSYNPSLLIVDDRLPDGNGGELLEEMLGECPHAVGVLTGSASQTLKNRAKKVSYFSKPYDPDALIIVAAAAWKALL